MHFRRQCKRLFIGGTIASQVELRIQTINAEESFEKE